MNFRKIQFAKGMALKQTIDFPFSSNELDEKDHKKKPAPSRFYREGRAALNNSLT